MKNLSSLSVQTSMNHVMNSKLSKMNAVLMRETDFQLVWRDIKFVAEPNTQNERIIINNVSGQLNSGELMAFLGPSGSGKSTVLECIIGKRKQGTTGIVEVRSNESSEMIKLNVAFIPQKDSLLHLLTTRESILFSTKMQISKKLFEKQPVEPATDRVSGKTYLPSDSKFCDVLCDSIIRELGLDVCAHTRIASCSGGQRKRISIAQELASRPRILFLDEPTSGLDSNSSYSLIKLLNDLTKSKNNPMAILVSIHQPSVKLFNAFDLAYVLSKKGSCIYQGRPTDIVGYLSKFDLNCPEYYNSADYIIEVANLDYGEEMIPKLAIGHLQHFERSTSNQMEANVINLSDLFGRNRFPEYYHTYLLTTRSLLVTLRDPLVFFLRFSSHILVAYFFAYYFGVDIGLRGGCSPEIGDFDPQKLDYMSNEIESELKNTYDTIGSFFYLIVFTAFSAIMPICIAFPLDMEVFTREYNNAWYTLRSYFLGKTLSEIPFQLIMPAMFAVFYFILSNQPFVYWRLANFTGITVLSTFIAQSFGYFIGALLMENVLAALFFGPLSCFPVMVLSGFFVKMKNMPELYRPIAYLSYMKHATDGLLISVYGFERCGNKTDKILKENRDAFEIWLRYKFGLEDQNLSADDERPTDRFVRNVVETITDPFISRATNKTQSLAMNEFDLEDNQLYLCWVFLLLYLVISRVIVYYAIRFKAKKYAS